MRKWIAVALLALTASPAFSADKDIVDTAVEAGSFKTLVAAAQAAGLVETLKSDLGRSPCPRPDRRRLRQAAAGHGRDAPEAREQGEARRDPDLPRHPRQGDGRRRRQAERPGRPRRSKARTVPITVSDARPSWSDPPRSSRPTSRPPTA